MELFNNINQILLKDPFFLNKKEKNLFLKKNLILLHKHHLKNCKEYNLISKKINFSFSEEKDIKDFIIIPSQLFKSFELKSITEENIYKTLTSSGTSSGKKSRIVLDKNSSILQSKVLVNIASSFIGKERVPMVCFDNKNILSKEKTFSARNAGLIGFSVFSNKIHFALDENLNLNLPELNSFLKSNRNSKTLFFGLTSIIWEFLNKLNISLVNKKNSYLIHGGGWKKLVDKKISNQKFKSTIMKKLKINKIFNYYGMVEQTGSIFFECEEGFFHTSNFSDIIIRNENLEIEKNNKKGIVQTISILPSSYPGMSLLTEDVGIIYGEDCCKCGRNGKIFKILGRLKNSELRGCSDNR